MSLTTNNNILLPQHESQLVKSGISFEIIQARGYRSITSKQELTRLGFADFQQRTPAMLIPQYSVDGNIAPWGYQIRPDTPRMHGIKGKAKTVKYEFPAGAESHLDINPLVLPMLKNANIPLWFTEGAKKADALASYGQCAINVPGVNGFKAKDETGSSVIMADFDYIPLNDRLVYLCFDSDWQTKPQVKRAINRLAEHLRRKGAAVVFIRLPMNGAEKNGIDDYLAAGHTIEEVIALSGPDLEIPPRPDTSDKPVIICNNRDLSEKGREAIIALKTKNDKNYHLFFRNGRAVYPHIDVAGNAVVAEIDKDSMPSFLAECAKFVNATRDGQTLITPQKDVVNHVLSAIANGSPVLPPFKGIIRTPYIKPSGEIVNKPGYDSESQFLYIEDSQLKIRATPEIPTSSDVRAAAELLKDTIVDFPFVDNASRTNALAALISPIIRPLVEGVLPLAVFNKPTPGTGAGLLTDSISIIANGQPMTNTVPPIREEEWQKTILSVLSAGTNIVCFDNVENELRSGSLAAVLTTSYYAARPMGETSFNGYPNNAVWFATGINVQLGGDLPRRAYQIKMNPKVAKPWLDKTRTFKHDQLVWIADIRGEVIAAILTLARAWIQAGRPIPKDLLVLGKFEPFCRVVGGILSYAGINDFLGNLNEMYEEMDNEERETAAFLAAWYEVQKEPTTVAALIKIMNSEGHEKLREALPDDIRTESDKINRSLGEWLKHRKDRIYDVVFPDGKQDQLLVADIGKSHSALLWMVGTEKEIEAKRDKKGGESAKPENTTPPTTPHRESASTGESGSQIVGLTHGGDEESPLKNSNPADRLPDSPLNVGHDGESGISKIHDSPTTGPKLVASAADTLPPPIPPTPSGSCVHCGKNTGYTFDFRNRKWLCMECGK